MSVREAQERIDSREFAEWMAFARVDGPFWQERDDIQAGLIAATIANTNRGKNKKAFKVEDFTPKWDRAPKREQTWQEQLAFVERVNKALGGKDLRKDK